MVSSRIDVGQDWGSQSAFDGTSVYFITVGDDHNITVIDPETLAITETIEAFDFDAPLSGRINALAASPANVTRTAIQPKRPSSLLGKFLANA